MLIDARTLTENTSLETDVCIVGAGAAGITLAREFIGQPFQVCLLESGGLEFERETQWLNQGDSIGLPYPPLDQVRLRYFGGTTNHWGGWCRALDEIDFLVRDWIPYSGWPFSKADLLPFYRRARSICQLPSLSHDVDARETKNIPHLPFIDHHVTRKMCLINPTRFGQVYRNEIARDDGIITYLYANVVEIETTDNARTVTRLHMVTLEGKRFFISAKLFILAAGGIENPRLLLLSNKAQTAGLGNENDLVGRFFMEHYELQTSLFLPSSPNIPAELYTQHPIHKGAVSSVLCLSPEITRQEGLVNFAFEIDSQPIYPEPPESVTSLRYILRSLRRGSIPKSFTEHLRNVIADIDGIADAAYRKYSGRPHSLYRVIITPEQVPNPNSRVTLSTERDRLNMYRVRLDWRLSAVDKRSIWRGTEIIARDIGRSGLGRLKFVLDDDERNWHILGRKHHMGTTRMQIDPKEGVVNENCRVHGISNLFIAGSSVFPTSGSAHATFTIVALAVRLADHVKSLMRRAL